VVIFGIFFILIFFSCHWPLMKISLQQAGAAGDIGMKSAEMCQSAAVFAFNFMSHIKAGKWTQW